MEKKCSTCGELYEELSSDPLFECGRCKQRREDDAQRAINFAFGDILNTGIAGGVDADITTPF